MIVNNFKCESCRNMDMCSGFKALKKFSEEYSKNPLGPDITVDFCSTYSEDGEAPENSNVEFQEEE